MRTTVLPSSPNGVIEASKKYTEAIQKVKDMNQPLHLNLQEENQGSPSIADIKRLLGSDDSFFTMEYIKHGK